MATAVYFVFSAVITTKSKECQQLCWNLDPQDKRLQVDEKLNDRQEAHGASNPMPKEPRLLNGRVDVENEPEARKEEPENRCLPQAWLPELESRCRDDSRQHPGDVKK